MQRVIVAKLAQKDGFCLSAEGYCEFRYNKAQMIDSI
jgi:hypothetical protein